MNNTKRVREALKLVEDTADDIRDKDYELTDQVKAARKVGASWQDLGVALGVTRQAAWEKYRAKPNGRIKPGEDTRNDVRP